MPENVVNELDSDLWYEIISDYELKLRNITRIELVFLDYPLKFRIMIRKFRITACNFDS